jgi:hypothetical protein
VYHSVDISDRSPLLYLDVSKRDVSVGSLATPFLFSKDCASV